MEHRHELKFKLSEAQMYILEQRIKLFLNIDPHQLDEYYTITSVYFDDIYNTCLKENIEGYDPRSKYRIRIYGHNFSHIKLEKKEKVKGMTKKTAVALSISEAKQIINELDYFVATPNKRTKILLSEMKVRGLRPTSIVEYDRSVYVYPIGNVRITFDKNIRATTKIQSFWENDTQSIPLLQEKVHILEVKYDEFLPKFIYDVLDIGILQRSGFSKYAASRKYES